MSHALLLELQAIRSELMTLSLKITESLSTQEREVSMKEMVSMMPPNCRSRDTIKRLIERGVIKSGAKKSGKRWSFSPSIVRKEMEEKRLQDLGIPAAKSRTLPLAARTSNQNT
jgi:hypothetical protein